jgi:hypothetical protein
MKIKIAKITFAVAFSMVAPILAQADDTLGPTQWAIDQGGDGMYYEIVGNGSFTWSDAQTLAQQQVFTVDGTDYYGTLAPVTSAAQASFLQNNLVIPSAGDFAITWTGDSLYFGTVFAGDQEMSDTSWFTWSSSSSIAPEDTFGQNAYYGLAMEGDGYGAANDLMLRDTPDQLGSYLVVFDVPPPVPEPSALALAGAGGACLLFRSLRRRL